MDKSAEKPATKSVINLLVMILCTVTVISVALSVFLTVSAFGKVKDYSGTKLVLYQGPKTMKSSPDATIKIDGKDVFVYNTTVNNTHTWVNNGLPQLSTTPMTYFDFQGMVKVEVTIPDIDINSCTVSPLSENIKPTINGHTVTFNVGKPGDYTIQFNKSANKAVHIFANPLQTNVPDKNDKNVVYISPGEWNVGNISLKSGQTLYIAGGAVIHGTISANFVKDVTVEGRGIIDGSNNPSFTQSGQTAQVPIDFRNSSNINVDGIIFLNPNAWTFNSYDSQDAKINNIKIISARPNGDGITMQSCTNYTITNSFVRSWDDSLVVKNYDQNTDNITFDNVQVWTDLAQSCEIGYETNKGNQTKSIISNVTFKNITVINNFHKPVMGIHNSDNALIENIHYQNITVENAQMGSGDSGTNNQLIDFGIMSSQWTTTSTRGSIRNVTLDNINVLSGKFPPSRIMGYDNTHTIENVSIKNLTILGKKITSQSAGKFLVNDYARNVTIE